MNDALPTMRLEALNALIANRPVRILGRVLLPELEGVADEAARDVGVAFGALDEATCAAWTQGLNAGAAVMHIAALPAVGMRAFLSRFTQRPSDVSAVGDACTALFRAGVRGQQVSVLEGRAHLFVVTGRKA